MAHDDRLRNACLLTMAFAAIFGSGGCIGAFSRPSYVMKISPNGKTVAFFWEDGIFIGMDGAKLAQNTDLFWCPVEQLDKPRSVRVGSSSENHASAWDMQFSPDSNHIAATAPPYHEIIVLDVESGKRTCIGEAGETITSFAWIGPGEVGYSTARPKSSEKHDMRIWRQRIGNSSRRQVYADDNVDGSVHAWGREHLGRWAPGGRHFLFMSPQYSGHLKLLDVANGTVRVIGRGGAHLAELSWAPNGSKAFCILAKTGNTGDIQGLLVMADSARGVDCTEAFRRSFPVHARRLEDSGRFVPIDDANTDADYPAAILAFSNASFPGLLPQWTPDGEYVMGNLVERGAILIRPVPWEVTYLDEPLDRTLAGSQWQGQKPWIYPLPVPGWVGVMPSRDLFETVFAVNYRCTIAKELFRNTHYAWAVSPDGTFALTLGASASGKLMLHPLRNWPHGASSEPATAPGEHAPLPATRHTAAGQ